MKKIKFLLLSTTILGFASCGSNTTQTEETPTAETPVVEPIVEGDTYGVDVSASKVNWLGKKIIGDDNHDGTIDLSSGSLKVAEGALVGGEFVVDMTTIKNNDLASDEEKAQLVGHLSNGDFFTVDSFPTASFVITSATPENVTGNLTIKGKTAEASFPYTITIEEGTVTAKGQLVFDRTKYGVIYGSGNFIADLAKNKVIDDNIYLDIELIATK